MILLNYFQMDLLNQMISPIKSSQMVMSLKEQRLVRHHLKIQIKTKTKNVQAQNHPQLMHEAESHFIPVQMENQWKSEF